MNKEEYKNKILFKDNVLVRTKYDLKTIENKLFTMILYKFQKEQNILKCKMTHEEIKSIVKNKNENSVKGIGNILDKLSTKKIYIEEVKNDGVNKIWHKYNLINGFSYDEEFNTFEIEATEKIYSLVSKKFEDGKYTPINLAVFLGLKNPYSQRLYDLLRLWSYSKKIINYKVEDLKEYLMLEESYPEYGNFKRRVIAPAIKELNSTDFFKIEVKEHKIGRKVESIDFIVEDLDKRKYFNKSKFIDKDIIEMDMSKIIDVKEDINKNNHTEENKTFYVPNKKLFTSKTLEYFTNDFKEIDFKDNTYKKLLQESILATLEKDDEEKIKVKSYNYFKKTLENKLNSKSDKKIIPSGKTRFHNINQTFNKYSPDELEKILIESQKDKFK